MTAQRKEVIRDHVLKAGFAVNEAKRHVSRADITESTRDTFKQLLFAIDELGIAVAALTEGQ